MSSAVDPGAGSSALGTSASRVMELELPRMWWLWLVTGVAWIVASLVILQFDKASITTVGVIIGCMFVFAGIEQLVMAASSDHLRWLWITFGVLMLIAGVLSFISPEATFAGFADMLGFLFLLVGVWWTIEAFLSQGTNPVWWLGLVSGVLMLIMSFWTAGQFFIEKAYILLVFAGVWALLHGIKDIVRAFQIRKLKSI